jgi:hypothetical protein
VGAIQRIDGYEFGHLEAGWRGDPREWLGLAGPVRAGVLGVERGGGGADSECVGEYLGWALADEFLPGALGVATQVAQVIPAREPGQQAGQRSATS